jgi:endonuclease/exonuclease/phosphatase (EEP) superfamily protein YafD
VKAVVAWTPAVMCAVWALVRLFGLESGYPAVPVITYTLFVVPVAMLATLVALVLRQWAPAVLAAAAAAALIAVVAPRAIGGPDSMAGMPVRVMSANVLHGGADAEQLTGYARDRRVDVLCVEELTPEFAARLDAAGIGRLLPHRVLSVQEGVSGSGIYSRFRLTKLPPPPSAGTNPITDTRASLTVGGAASIDVTAVHNLPVPASPNGVDNWAESLSRLPSAPAAGPIHVLAGDFNATLDQSAFRDLLDRGYYDAAERMGDGLTPTWPAIRGRNRYLPVTIDHVLYDRNRLGVLDYDVLDLDRSDHRTLYAELVIPR